jgi:preprotein translocase subunit YajC
MFLVLVVIVLGILVFLISRMLRARASKRPDNVQKAKDRKALGTAYQTNTQLIEPTWVRK